MPVDFYIDPKGLEQILVEFTNKLRVQAIDLEAHKLLLESFKQSHVLSNEVITQLDSLFATSKQNVRAKIDSAADEQIESIRRAFQRPTANMIEMLDQIFSSKKLPS